MNSMSFGRKIVLGVGVLVLTGFGYLTISDSVKEVTRPRISVYAATYEQIAKRSAFHRQVIQAYSACALNAPTWDKNALRSEDCLSRVMIDLDGQGLPREALFGIEQEIRKGERAINEREFYAARPQKP